MVIAVGILFSINDSKEQSVPSDTDRDAGSRAAWFDRKRVYQKLFLKGGFRENH